MNNKAQDEYVALVMSRLPFKAIAWKDELEPLVKQAWLAGYQKGQADATRIVSPEPEETR